MEFCNAKLQRLLKQKLVSHNAFICWQILGDEIGKGEYGRVYKGLDLENEEFVAIKQVSLEDIPQEDLDIIMVEELNIIMVCTLKSLKSLFSILFFWVQLMR